MLSHTTKSSILVIELLMIAHQIAAVEQIAQPGMYLAGELDNPCYGRNDGFARDLSSCQQYFSCLNGTAYNGTCERDYFFDGETEKCRLNEDKVCFKCNPNKNYQLFSVPKACSQYILCFNGKPKLHLCSNGLVFDGRNRIHQCNKAPECHREEAVDIDDCPSIKDEPIFYGEPSDRSV